MSGYVSMTSNGHHIKFHKIKAGEYLCDTGGVVLDIKNIDAVYDMFQTFVGENMYYKSGDRTELVYKKVRSIYRKNKSKYDYKFNCVFHHQLNGTRDINKIMDIPYQENSGSYSELTDTTYTMMANCLLPHIKVGYRKNDGKYITIQKGQTVLDNPSNNYSISPEWLESQDLPRDMQCLGLFIWYKLQEFDEYIDNMEMDNFGEIQELCTKAGISVFDYLNSKPEDMCRIVADIYKNNNNFSECQEMVRKLMELKQPVSKAIEV
jgi:hypothetical protein